MKWSTGRNTLGAVTLAAAVAACTTMPDRIESLERARAAVQSASALPEVQQVAPAELRRAQQALDRADELVDDRADLELIQHEAYIATRYADTASALVGAEAAEDRIEALENERQQVVLENRERQAAAADARRERSASCKRARDARRGCRAAR